MTVEVENAGGPSVVLATPADGARLTAGRPVRVIARGARADRVWIAVDGRRSWSGTAAELSGTWTPAAGRHEVVAVAERDGAPSAYDSAVVTAVEPGRTVTPPPPAPRTPPASPPPARPRRPGATPPAPAAPPPASSPRPPAAPPVTPPVASPPAFGPSPAPPAAAPPRPPAPPVAPAPERDPGEGSALPLPPGSDPGPPSGPTGPGGADPVPPPEPPASDAPEPVAEAAGITSIEQVARAAAFPLLLLLAALAYAALQRYLDGGPKLAWRGRGRPDDVVVVF